jgi:hypothetical protein
VKLSSKLFSQSIEEYHEKNKVVFCMGLHLCGYLSVRLVDLFNSNDAIYCGVLSPCCMPKRRKRTKDIKENRIDLSTLQKAAVFCYDVWCLDLCFNIKTQLQRANISRTVVRDSLVLTEKSTYVIAKRLLKF